MRKINQYKGIIKIIIVLVVILLILIFLKGLPQRMIRNKLYLDENYISEGRDEFNYISSGPSGFLELSYKHKLYLYVENEYVYLDSFYTPEKNNIGSMYIKYIGKDDFNNLYYIDGVVDYFFTINKNDNSYIFLNNYLNEHQGENLVNDKYLEGIIPILCGFFKDNYEQYELEGAYRQIQEFN